MGFGSDADFSLGFLLLEGCEFIIGHFTQINVRLVLINYLLSFLKGVILVCDMDFITP